MRRGGGGGGAQKRNRQTHRQNEHLRQSTLLSVTCAAKDYVSDAKKINSAPLC